MLEKLISQLDISLSSEHSTVCQRALVLWKSDEIRELLTSPAVLRRVAPRIVEIILRKTSAHWNATVRKMSGAVLRILDDAAPEFTATCACRAWSCDSVSSAKEHLRDVMDSLNPLESTEEEKGEDIEADAAFPTDFAAGGTYVPTKHQGTSVMNIVQGRVLGEGTFGQVLYGLRVRAGAPKSSWPEVALKRMTAKHSEIAQREAAVMDAVKHPNVTRLLAVYSSSKHIHLVLEYAAKGDLHTHLAELGTLETSAARFVAAEVCAGLVAVHLAGLVYGDLKPENVLIHESGHAKLGDFGSARWADDARANIAIEGTLHYLAPELLKGKPLTRGADWWAFGCLVYQMLAGRPPVVDAHDDKIMRRIVDFDLDGKSDDIFPHGFPEDARILVTLLLQPSLSRRLASSAPASESIHIMQRCSFFAGHIDIARAYTMRAPSFAVGEVKPAGGNWTQRTYSMMVSPLMRRYDSAKGALSAIDATSLERDAPWFDASYKSKGIQKTKPPLESIVKESHKASLRRRLKSEP